MKFGEHLRCTGNFAAPRAGELGEQFMMEVLTHATMHNIKYGNVPKYGWHLQ